MKPRFVPMLERCIEEGIELGWRMAREAGFIINDENPMTHSLERFAALVAADEREACAKVCDSSDKSTHPADLADAIRARGSDAA